MVILIAAIIVFGVIFIAPCVITCFELMQIVDAQINHNS